MTKALTTALAVLALAAPVAAASFNSRVREANELFVGGRPDMAVEAYRELQTERPEAPGLPYNIGSAAYARAVARFEAGEMEEALAALDEAGSAFERVAAMEAGELRTHARYNYANAVLQRAKIFQAADQYAEAVQGFEEAVRQYERMLEHHPGYAPARHNLAHARLLWKQLLQNPPPPDEEQQEEQDQPDRPQEEQPGASVARAETDLPRATVQTSAEEASAAVRLVEPNAEELP